MTDSRLGSQRPNLLHEPPDAVDWAWSDLAVEFAEHVGYRLDEWQVWLVRWSFARRADGLWAARDVGVEISRQNGKNIWLEVVQLAGLILFGDRLLRHTAHRVETSHEHFVSMMERISGSPELMEYMPKRSNTGFVRSHGFESIEFDNGARLQFKARQNSTGRGPRPQKVFFDEALILDDEKTGAMTPGVSAQPNPQLLYASSPPMFDSVVQHRLRDRAMNPSPGDRFFYAAWNNPADTDPDDEESWFIANASLGYGRLTLESLRANRRALDPRYFLREHAGVPEPPLTTANIIDAALWADLAEGTSEATSQHAWALSVSPDRKWASIGIAGRRTDGRIHVEWQHHQPGTAWVVEACQAMYRKRKIALRVAASSAEASLIEDIREGGVEVVEVVAGEVARATGEFIDAVNNYGLRHLGQRSLDKAVQHAILKTTESGASVWAERSSEVEITPLKAVTVALGGVTETGRRPRIHVYDPNWKREEV